MTHSSLIASSFVSPRINQAQRLEHAILINIFRRTRIRSFLLHIVRKMSHSTAKSLIFLTIKKIHVGLFSRRDYKDQNSPRASHLMLNHMLNCVLDLYTTRICHWTIRVLICVRFGICQIKIRQKLTRNVNSNNAISRCNYSFCKRNKGSLEEKWVLRCPNMFHN